MACSLANINLGKAPEIIGYSDNQIIYWTSEGRG